jgi:GAF domain-containing protein
MQKLDSGFNNLLDQKVAELTRTNAALDVQSRLFRLVAEISTQLARSDDFLTTLKGALQKLGEAAQADRVTLWEERGRSPGGPRDHVIVTEWCARGILSHAECGLDVIASDAAGQITDRLRLGESHFVRYEQINEDFRKLFDRLGILSIASAPITVNGLYTGCVAFYMCERGQIRDDRHLEALTAAADAIAASIQQRKDAKRLSDERVFALKALSA